MQQFNLYDRGLLPPPPDWLLRGALALGLAGCLAAAAHGGFERALLTRLLAQPAAADEAADTTGVDADPELQALRERVRQRGALLESHRRSGGSVDHAGATLRGIAAALPPDAWLSQVELHADRSVRIAGHTLEAGSLHGFTQQLQSQPALRGMPLQSLAVERIEAGAGDDPAPSRLRFRLQAGPAGSGESGETP